MASGIRFWPMLNVYYSYVSDKEHDHRVLYCKFVDDSSNVIQEGVPGARNKEMIKDREWDISFIFTKKLE